MIGIMFGFLFFIFLGIVMQGLRKIPAEPPTKAVVTRLGERTGAVKKEGWRFFLFYPFVNGYVPINVTKVNLNFLPHGVRTPDMAEIEMKVHLTFSPNPEIISGQTQLIQYLNSGGESGVKEILEDIVLESVREFAITPQTKPFTWEEAVKMDKEFLAEIVASILGIDAKNPDPENQEEVRRISTELKQGNGKMKIPTLGIILHRVNVVSIQPKGEVLSGAAEKVAKERKERDAEQIELQHIREQVALMVKDLKITPKEAIELIQTERKKVTKNIEERNYSGLGNSGIIGAVADKFLNNK